MQLEAGGKLALALMLLGVAAFWFWFNFRKRHGQYSVQNITYAVTCMSCGKDSSLTTREMNRLIRAGASLSADYQMRRFPCQFCGQTNVIMKAGIPDVRFAPRN